MRATTALNVRSWLTRTESSALLVTAVACIALVGVAMTTRGGSEAVSATLGALDVIVFFALGAGVEAYALRWADWSGGAVVLLGYGARIGLLTMVAMLLAKTPWLSSPMWFGAGMVVATLAWPVGLLAGHVTGRWPVYDHPYIQGVSA